MQYDSESVRRLIQHLYEAVAPVMTIDETFTIDESALPADDRATLQRNGSTLVVAFAGRLRDDAETAYNEIDKTLRPDNLYALFRQNTSDVDGPQPHIIYIAYGRQPEPQPYAIWLPLLMFVATIFSVLMTGTIIAIGDIELSDPQRAKSLMDNLFTNLWRGIPYALAILLILVPHEMGHYLMMRRYQVPASLPYFIPAFGLSPFGTFGAAIVLRGTLRNRKWLFDVGAAGPLAGLVMAIPILLIGLATSQVVPLSGGIVEGNSILYALAKVIVFGEFLPNGTHDVMLNQLAWAGWTGLFVTALNLIPVGQLDGGHVLFSLLGDWARRLYWPLMLTMIGLMLFVSSVWLIFVLMLLFFGRLYAVPYDAITPLDAPRRALAIFTLLIFVLIFPPVPIYNPAAPGGLLTGFMVLTLVLLGGNRPGRPRLAPYQP